MNNLIFSDKLLIFVSSLALIVTMIFVAMIFVDLNDIWVEISKYQERISNLETLLLIQMDKTGCSI